MASQCWLADLSVFLNVRRILQTMQANIGQDGQVWILKILTSNILNIVAYTHPRQQNSSQNCTWKLVFPYQILYIPTHPTHQQITLTLYPIHSINIQNQYIYLVQKIINIKNMDQQQPNNPNHNNQQPIPVSSNSQQQQTTTADQGNVNNTDNMGQIGHVEHVHMDDEEWEDEDDGDDGSGDHDYQDDEQSGMGMEMEIMDDSDSMDDDDGIDDDDFEEEDDADDTKKKITIKNINLNALKGPMNHIISNLDKATPLAQLIKVPPSKKINKQVCAKVIKRGNTVIECFDCRMDQTCIICLDCFKNGNHENHRYVAKEGGGGCCDCGDPQAWSQKGFCKQHSGKFVDFQIEQDIVEEFSNSVNGLMYIYFHLVIKNDSSTQLYVKRLFDFLKQLNQDNTYYNKLTALCLTRKLPAQYSLNEELDKHTILQNILTSKVSGRFFSRWFDLFINMFSYYPFKMAILKHYIQNYGDIIDGEKSSINNGISISCQLITSYKLVEQYSLENKIGIGQKGKKITNIKQLRNYYSMFVHDISSLASLSQTTPYSYWKMHINSHEGIRNLFHYYKVVMKKVKAQESTKSEAELCAIYINFAEVQLNIVKAFANIVKVVAKDEVLLGKVICTLWAESEKIWNQNPESLSILRPLQRCLTIALFAYFNHSLDNLSLHKQKLIHLLKIHPENFETGCKMILSRMFKTLFYYAKSQAQPGLGQTLYLYLYIYKIYSRILFMTDILSIKIFLLLLGREYPITFESVIDLDRHKLENQAYTNEKTNFFINVVKTIKYAYTHSCPEIYVSYSIDEDKKMYEKQIAILILNYFKEYSKQDTYSVSQIQLKTQLLQSIFPKQCKMGQNWVKNNCTLNKKNKSYILDKNIIANAPTKIVGLNFDDFITNVPSKDPFADCMKSVVGVSGYNLQIFNLIWNQITLQSVHKTVHTLFDKQNVDNVMPLLPLLCCIHLTEKQNKKKCSGKHGYLQETLVKFSTKIPTNTIAILQLEAISEEPAQSRQQQKQKSKDLKAQKLEKMRKKQQTFLSEMNLVTEQFQQEKIQKFNTQSENKLLQQKCCCICRHELNQNSVYIVNMNVRNHERLLKLGVGVECLNFSSCRHVFDYKCIEKMYRKNSITNSIACPLCKSTGNIIFPVMEKFNAKFEEKIAVRVAEILKQVKSNADFYEQIIKSFYHYFLLCAIDFERTLETKRELYRTIFLILKKNIPQKQLQLLKQKLSSGKIQKKYEKDLVELKNQTERSAMSFFLNLLVNQNQQAAELQERVADMEKKQLIQEPKAMRNKLVEKIDLEEKMKQFWLFSESVRVLLDYLSKENIKQHEMQQENSSSFVMQCIKTLTNQNMQHLKLMEQKSIIDIEKIHILRQLPRHYSQIGAGKKCSACSQISVNLVMCLLCDWRGCQSCENGYAKTHINSLHGQVGAVMVVNKALAYYINNDKPILAGRLYEDQWQKDLKKATNWDEFELNVNLYNQIERRLKYDEIPSHKANKQ